MTREEFEEIISSFDELIDWCYDYDCNICSCIYDKYAYNEFINEQLCDWAREYDWTEMRDILVNLPTGYDYYTRNGYGEWEGLENYDFDDYYHDVLQWGDDNEIWDVEDEDPEEESQNCDDEEETPIEIENISFSELFLSSVSTMQAIRQKEEEHEIKEKEEFNEFIADMVSMT